MEFKGALRSSFASAWNCASEEQTAERNNGSAAEAATCGGGKRRGRAWTAERDRRGACRSTKEMCEKNVLQRELGVGRYG